jgi:hypothetical protein
MSINPECPTCPIGDNPNLCFFASRVESVYASEAIASSPHENMTVAEDEVRQGDVTKADITRLRPALEADMNLSLNGCFIPLHERAQADREILAILTDEQSIAVAGCATRRLRGTCEL